MLLPNLSAPLSSAPAYPELQFDPLRLLSLSDRTLARIHALPALFAVYLSMLEHFLDSTAHSILLLSKHAEKVRPCPRPPPPPLLLVLSNLLLSAPRMPIFRRSGRVSSNQSSSILTMSHSSVFIHITTTNSTLQSAKNKEVGTLIYAQESAVVQRLFENLSDFVSEQTLERQSEHVGQFCAWLHRRCVQKPLLIKVLFYQGLPGPFLLNCPSSWTHQLLAVFIPTLVARVPAFHVALEWLPELLAADQASTRQFAVTTAAHLLDQYRVPKGYELARLVIAHCRQDPALRSGTTLLLLGPFLASPAQPHFGRAAMPP